MLALLLCGFCELRGTNGRAEDRRLVLKAVDVFPISQGDGKGSKKPKKADGDSSYYLYA
jgi:hypothetical protein